MSSSQHLYHTDEQVPESGTYICEAGTKKKLEAGEQFPVGTDKNEPTTWRLAGGTHETGNKVMENGTYVDEDGDKVELTHGDTFPTCPKSGDSTVWTHL